ncbi:hypothetical protein ACFE04_021752 [Oxalis oulophora]
MDMNDQTSLRREIGDFLEQNIYMEEIKSMINHKRRRLIINVSDLHSFRDLAPRVLRNPSDYLQLFCDSATEIARNIDPKYLKEGELVLVGFEGPFVSRRVTPGELLSEFIGSMVCVEGIITKCSLVRPKVVKSVFINVQAGSTLDNVEEWRWKFTMMLRNKDEQEVMSREKRDRRDFEQISALATRMGLKRAEFTKGIVNPVLGSAGVGGAMAVYGAFDALRPWKSRPEGIYQRRNLSFHRFGDIDLYMCLIARLGGLLELLLALLDCLKIKYVFCRNLSSNSLEGRLPSGLGHKSLTTLDLSNSQFTGSMPDSLTTSSLKLMILNDNLLEGRVPEQLYSIGVHGGEIEYVTIYFTC